MDRHAGSTVAIWAVAAVLALLAGWRLAGCPSAAGGPAPVRLDPDAGARPGAPDGEATGSAAGGAHAASSRGERLFVHVAGEVRRPGLLRLTPRARVATALARAGGPTGRADLKLVNLAAPVQDGQQIVVPARGAAGAAAAGAGAAAATEGAATAAPIQLSTATAEQLEEIDGIGPTLAGRIVEFRDGSGGIRSIDELAEVDGIGEGRLATLREALRP